MMRHAFRGDNRDLAETAYGTGTVGPGALENKLMHSTLLYRVTVAAAALKQAADDFTRALRVTVEEIAADKVAVTAILAHRLVVHIYDDAVLVADGDGAVQPPSPVRNHVNSFLPLKLIKIAVLAKNQHKMKTGVFLSEIFSRFTPAE